MPLPIPPAPSRPASRRYDSFGRIIASAGSLPTYGYSGREPDASGLVYYRARYYAPELGRFTQPDPIGLAGGINRYAYVGGSPVNFRDPSGWRAVVANPGGQTAYGGNADLLDPLAAMSPQDASAYETQGGMLGTRSVMQPIVEVGIVAGVTTLTAGVGGGPVARLLMGRAVREELSATESAGSSGVIATDRLPPLRQAYVDAVSDLKPMADSLRAAGADTETIARTVHAERRAIGERFKAMTPPDKLAEIYERNLQKYGDKLGPTVDWLRARGKNWDQIIESATRTGGKDLGF